MADSPTPSARLADFVSELMIDDIPAEAVREAERCFVDTVGVTLAGAAEGAGATAARIATTEGSTTVLGRNQTAPITDAVLVNGTAGHGLDFDDVCWGMDGHPSVTLVAPALAIGERIDATGQDLLAAFVAGFETECYLSGPISPGHYERGWHATSTFGTFGAVATAVSLLNLSPPSVRRALNIAASMPAGLKRNFGSMVKPLHVGQAVRSGVTAALLATDGFTADPAAIGGEGGFWDLYAGPEGVDEEATYALGERWALLEEGVNVKKYPCCHFTHTGIANVVDIVGEHGIDPDEIHRIVVTASRGADDALVHDDPVDVLAAKFSMPYTLAYGAVHGTVDLAAFESAALADERVEAIRRCVDFETDTDLEYDSLASSVRVEINSGNIYERQRSTPPGAPGTPLSRSELREKYEMCASRALPTPAVDRTWAALDSLRELDTVRELLADL